MGVWSAFGSALPTILWPWPSFQLNDCKSFTLASVQAAGKAIRERGGALVYLSKIDPDQRPNGAALK
jgi:hypothetical protein